MSKKKETKTKDYDDVYKEMVAQMIENSKSFPNAVPAKEEEKLEKKKKAKKAKEEKKKPIENTSIYGTSLTFGRDGARGAWDYNSNGASDYGDFGGEGGAE